MFFGIGLFLSYYVKPEEDDVIIFDKVSEKNYYNYEHSCVHMLTYLIYLKVKCCMLMISSSRGKHLWAIKISSVNVKNTLWLF